MKHIRFAFIDALLLIKGEFNHADFSENGEGYQLSKPHYTRVLNEYKSLFPGCIEYCFSARKFKPLKGFKGALLPGYDIEERKEAAKDLLDILKDFGGDLKKIKAAYMESLIVIEGHFNMMAIEETFSLSRPQLTRDLRAYKTQHPNQFEYSHAERQFVKKKGFNAPIVRSLKGHYGKKSTIQQKSYIIWNNVYFLRQVEKGIVARFVD